MIRVLTTALLAASGSSVVADESLEQRALDAHWHLIEQRCPSEAAAITQQTKDQMNAVLREKIEIDGAEGLWDFAFSVWDGNGRPYVASHHGLAFVAIGSVQAHGIQDLTNYLGSGDPAAHEIEPDKLHEAARASTNLLKCLLPTKGEAKRFQASDDKNDQLYLKALMILECSNWIEMSEALLALDIAQAGSPAIELSASEIDSNVFQDMEESAFKQCEEGYLL